MKAHSTLELEPRHLSADTRPTPQALWQRYHTTTESGAENDVVERYLPLVKTVVGRVAMNLPTQISMDDLHSAGLVGLLQAVRRFNPECGASFETFARVRIRGAVLDELRRMDWAPRPVHERAKQIQHAIGDLEQHMGRLPDESEVASALRISLDEYRRWLDEVRPVTWIHLDALMNPQGSDPSTNHEYIADESSASPTENAVRDELIEVIMGRLKQLPPMQQKVLAFYYFEDMRLREIAAIFGVTESRISQIHSQAVLSLRAFLNKFDSTSPARALETRS